MPLYGGGLIDAWPAWAVDALAVCRAEVAAVRAYVQAEQMYRPEVNRG